LIARKFLQNIFQRWNISASRWLSIDVSWSIWQNRQGINARRYVLVGN
jgi:hypothetical protein